MNRSLKKHGETVYLNWLSAQKLVFDGNKPGHGIHSFRQYMNDTLAREALDTLDPLAPTLWPFCHLPVSRVMDTCLH
ncbi:hypothetical protein ACEWPM_012175 [Roseovarius sp. S4756]|uniref:hypothetical protein n=1 Tax=Roseovarius maritimus TaxID=3342637 RepID=UPI00372685E8